MKKRMKKARRDIAGLPDSTYRKLLEQEQQETGAASLFATDTSEHNSDEEYEMADLTEPLNEEHLVDLSRLIATRGDLRTFGIEGLKLPPSIIDSALTNNPRDIHEAAYSVLSEWWKRQENPVAAFNALVAALRKCGMKKLALQLVAFAQKRDSTNIEAATPVSHEDTSPISISSPQQQGQREPALTAPHQALLNSDAQTLNDAHLLKLSHSITTPTELRRLGIEGLKLKSSTIQSALTNNPGDIHEAALRVLSTWRAQYRYQSEAFREIIAALKKCHMNQLALQLTEKCHSTDAEAALKKCDTNQYASQLESQPRTATSLNGPRIETKRESPKTPESEPLLARGQVNTIKFIIPVFFINFI